jgi:tetratricopeptide (TPR) repeat protein
LIRFPALLLLIATAAAAQPRQEGQLDGNPTLFTVLAAINAAGYDADLDSPLNFGVRKQVREAVAAANAPSVEALKSFFAAHRQKDWSAELSQYVSFALTLDGPPDFQFRLKPNELPPDVTALLGFETLLPAFYKEAGIEDLWRRSQPAYEQVIARYHGPVSRALLEANAYLRNPTSGYLGRRFQIYVDLLGAPNQIQSRSYKDDYFVVVTPSPEPQVNDVRHAYLHYVLDPLSLKYFEQLNRLKGMADYAQSAPALDAPYKSDFVLLATECMIKAVESRLAPAPLRKEIVDEAFRQGFVMTPAFAEGLPVFEQQPRAMRLYFPDLVQAVDLKREERRLNEVEFAAAAAPRRVEAPASATLSGAEKTLADAEERYRERELEKAKTLYLRALEETSRSPLHARAYYGLARIAALRKDPELAEKLFARTLEMSPDNDTKSWAHVYLGRLAEAAGEREEAARNYRTVLSMEGASPGARAAAEKALGQQNHD